MREMAARQTTSYHRMRGPGDLPHPHDPQDEPLDWGDEDEAYRDAWIADRATQLTAVRLRDEGQVNSALSELFTIGAGDALENALTRFYLAFDEAQTDAAMAEAGLAFFRSLQPTVESRIREDAESDAAGEFDAMRRAA